MRRTHESQATFVPAKRWVYRDKILISDFHWLYSSFIIRIGSHNYCWGSVWGELLVLHVPRWIIVGCFYTSPHFWSHNKFCFVFAQLYRLHLKPEFPRPLCLPGTATGSHLQSLRLKKTPSVTITGLEVCVKVWHSRQTCSKGRLKKNSNVNWREQKNCKKFTRKKFNIWGAEIFFWNMGGESYKRVQQKCKLKGNNEL